MSVPTIAIPAELAAKFAANRARYGDLKMMADQPEGDAKSPESQDDQKPDEKPDDAAENDEKLGESGKKALQQERDARKALERQVASLSESKKVLDSLASVFGGEKKAEQVDLAKEIADLKANLEVSELARQHGITDEKDIDLIRLASPDARSALAARLKPAEHGTPKPEHRSDRSVGRGANGEGRATSVASGRDLYNERHGKK